MFYGKDIKELQEQLHEIKKELSDQVLDPYDYYYDETGRTLQVTLPGIKSKIKNLEKENKKLKAIVAELCNYVYDDKRGAK